MVYFCSYTLIYLEALKVFPVERNSPSRQSPHILFCVALHICVMSSNRLQCLQILQNGNKLFRALSRYACFGKMKDSPGLSKGITGGGHLPIFWVRMCGWSPRTPPHSYTRSSEKHDPFIYFPYRKLTPFIYYF